MKITWVVLLVSVVGFPAPSLAADPELPQEVRAALEKNARSLTDLTIAGAKSRRMLASAAKALEALGTLEDEAAFTQSVRFELWLQGTKIHESFRYPPNPPYKSGKGVDESSYDGTKYFSGSIDPSRPATPGNLMIQGAASMKPQGLDFALWYLSESGFSGPLRGNEMGRPIESLVLARAAAGHVESVRDVSRDGQKLLEVVIEYPEPWASRATAPVEKDASIKSLRGESKQLQMRIERERRRQAGQSRLCRFLLDGGMGYAVREEWESRAKGGAVMFHTTNSDFRQVEPGGAWLPRRCEVVSHAYETAPLYTSPEPLYATEIQIDKIERTTFSDDQFRIWYDHPGIFVSDTTDPRSTPARPYSYHTTSGKPLEDVASSPDRRWLFIGGAVVLAVVLAVALSARSRRQVSA